MFDDLDRVLKTRKEPHVPEHLSARIIAAASRDKYETRETAQRGWRGFVSDLADMFAIPQPAYALAAAVLVLVLGAVLGSAAQDFDALGLLTPGELASFMALGDSLQVGEWV